MRNPALAVLLNCLLAGAALGQPVPARDPEAEWKTKIDASFTVATVGDIIAPLPFSSDDPEYLAVVEPLRKADIGFANMESSLVDFAAYSDARAGSVAPLEVGESIRALGVTMMSRANNHTLDGGIEGMVATDRALDQLGITHAGTGDNLQEARAARFRSTPKGRVGLVSMFSIADTGMFGPNYLHAAATEQIGSIGGAPGVHGLAVTGYNVVTPDQLVRLRDIAQGTYGERAAAYQPAATDRPERFRFYDQWYEAGRDPGAVHYQIRPDDLRGTLQSIRSGKTYGDFLIATIHAHQGPRFCGKCSFGATKALKEDINHQPADFLVELAHAAIDNGADMFVTHGVHALAGVEIYKGRPVFYGLSNFVFQFSLQFGGGYDAMANYEKRSELENPASLASVVATSRFEKGRLVEVVLHPVDLGDRSRPLSQLGLPRRPSPDRARQILEALSAYSRPFGTRIDIKGGLGFIRP